MARTSGSSVDAEFEEKLRHSVRKGLKDKPHDYRPAMNRAILDQKQVIWDQMAEITQAMTTRNASRKLRTTITNAWDNPHIYHVSIEVTAYSPHQGGRIGWPESVDMTLRLQAGTWSAEVAGRSGRHGDSWDLSKTPTPPPVESTGRSED